MVSCSPIKVCQKLKSTLDLKIYGLLRAMIDRKKERKKEKIYLTIARYNKKIKHTISLSEYDDIKKMPNISYEGKVPSKATVAEN